MKIRILYMVKKNLGILLSFFFILVSWPLVVLAHQPRMVETEMIDVANPEISKAYYGRLSGKPHAYTISASSSFDLYVNILVPFVEGPGKKITVEIFKGEQPLGNLSPRKGHWEEFFEPFGQSMYWKGPEFKLRSEAGTYKVLVKSSEKNIRYVLATGEIEAFDTTESLAAILLIPQLKKLFFEESPVSFILSPLGWGYILLLQVLVLLVGWVILKILKAIGIEIQRKYLKNYSKNIMLLSIIFWVSLLFWAVSNTWHPILILTSGFALFIFIVSWREFKVSKQNEA